jgi:hypothetical protein
MVNDKSLEGLAGQWREACYEYLPERASELASILKLGLQRRVGPVEIDDLFEEIDAGVAALQLRPAESVPVRRRLSELALAYQPMGGADIEIDFDPFNSETWSDEESLVAALFKMAETGSGNGLGLTPEADELGTPGFVTPVVIPQVGEIRHGLGFNAPAPRWEIREERKGFSLRQGIGLVRRVEMETERLKADAALCTYVAAASIYRLLAPKPRQIRMWKRADRIREVAMETRINRGEEPLAGFVGL